MPKPLPPATIANLAPPPSAYPYQFFENVEQHPFYASANGLDLRNVWWLMDASFLSYSTEADVRAVFQRKAFGSPVSVRWFSGMRTTQCYVADADDWIVMAFRGTQVDDFWPSVLDWSIDARIMPVPDAHGDSVHAGFLAAIREVWSDVIGHVKTLQARRSRPLWVTGHSLGAALATIAANLCGDEPDSGLHAVYTYGSPRVGDQPFVRRIGAPVWRMRNNSDLVTNVPLGLVFRHAGALALVDGAGHWHVDPSPAEEALFEASTTGLSSNQAHHVGSLLHLAEQGVPLPGPLADHAPINYAIRLWNCYEASL